MAVYINHTNPITSYVSNGASSDRLASTHAPTNTCSVHSLLWRGNHCGRLHSIWNWRNLPMLSWYAFSLSGPAANQVASPVGRCWRKQLDSRNGIIWQTNFDKTLQICMLSCHGIDGLVDPCQGSGVEKGCWVGVVGSCGASRDGVGHEQTLASGCTGPRPGLGDGKEGRLGVHRSCGASRALKSTLSKYNLKSHFQSCRAFVTRLFYVHILHNVHKFICF